MVAFGVEVLFAERAFELFCCVPDVHPEAAEEVESEESVVLSVFFVVSWEVEKSLAEFAIDDFFDVVFAIVGEF